jgi:alpha-beta hydrolase superfamily lysophospholipase
VPVQRRTTWFQDVLAAVAAASGIGYVATAYSISRWLTRTTPAKPAAPTDTRSTWEDLHCRTVDGLDLAGWVVTPLKRIRFLTAAGYRCVAFDHRGHGQSGGRRTSFGYFEGRDAAAVLELVQRRWPDEPHAALGMSMGAASLCFAAAQARRCQAVILESLYHDLASAFQARLGCGYPPWFGRFSRGVIWVTERRLGVRLTQVAPAAHVHELHPAPVLLLTGSEDPHAPPPDVHRLYNSCHEPREVCVIAGAAHADVCETGGEQYQNLVLDFLRRKLGT